MAEALFAFFLLGMVLFLFYDLLRFLRVLSASAVFAFFSDLLWWIAAAFACFSLLLVYFDGRIRVLCLLVCGAGFAGAYFTLGSVTRAIWYRIAHPLHKCIAKMKKKGQKVNKKVKKVLQLPFKLLYNKFSVFRKKSRSAEAGTEAEAER